jgi:UDP-N-acetylmuramoyl-tripeptide--D-alanyl-D-alanine ligase
MTVLLAVQKTVQSSPKNHNNEIGVAQTLLSIAPETDIMIVEMGMRGLRQIALLSTHAEPDISVITNIGSAHIGLLGSQEAIAEAKTEIIEGMNPEAGIIVVNGDDPLLLRKTMEKWEGREETFSLHDVSHIHRLEAGGVSFVYEELTFLLGLPGQHNMMNALACLKVAECLNLRLKGLTKAMQSYDGGDGRWQREQLSADKNVWVINDAYNANPESLRASLVSFDEKQLGAGTLRQFVVLSHMAELGDYEQSAYVRLVDWMLAREPSFTLLFVGEKAQAFYQLTINTKLKSYWFASIEEVLSWVQTEAFENTIFLLKGSREAGLERFIPGLSAQLAAAHAVS